MITTPASFRTMLLVTSLLAMPAWGQGAHEAGRRGEPIPAGLSLADKAARRFPQAVRVGDLIDRQVLDATNHQHVLGRVQGVSRDAQGGVLLVLRYGGVLGFGTSPRAVPIEATALLGHFVQVTDVEPAALGAMPDWTGAGTTPLRADEVIRVGLNRN